MSAQAPIRSIAPEAPVRACWQCTLLVALAVVLPIIGGCETEKQERFNQSNDDGIHLYQSGNYAGAREQFEVALALGPTDANVLFNVGQCCDRLNQADQAENYYKQCLKASANYEDCRHALAVLLYRTNRKAEADQMIQTWLNNQPQLGGAYAEDGWRLRQSGENQLAVGRFQQALDYDPRNLRAMVELGQIYEDQQRPAYALTMYTRALELKPEQPELKDRVNQLKAQGVGKPLPD